MSVIMRLYLGETNHAWSLVLYTDMLTNMVAA
jgi:hypothetical protein